MASGASTRGLVLAVLVDGKPKSLRDVVRATGLRRSAVRRHINVLVKARLVTKKLYGEITSL